MWNDGVRVRAKRIKVSEEDGEWMAVEEERHCRGDFFDLTLMRKEPPVDEDFVNATRLLDWMPALVINAPSALRGVEREAVHLSLCRVDCPDMGGEPRR